MYSNMIQQHVVFCIFYLFIYLLFSIRVFFREHLRFTGQQEKGEAISLTPLCHSKRLPRYLHISRAITARSSPLDSNWEPLVSERKSLSTKLRALTRFDKNTFWIILIKPLLCNTDLIKFLTKIRLKISGVTFKN